METETIIRSGMGYEPPEEDIWELKDALEYFEINHKRNRLITSEILHTWDKSRNSDFLLQIEYLRTKYPIKVTNSKDDILIRIPKKVIPFLMNESPECTGRIRRKLIEEAIKNMDFEELNQLIPTKKYILERRLRQDKIMRNFFTKHLDKIKLEIYPKILLK